MKFKFNPTSLKLRGARKYIYLVNDVTNMLLKKEEIHQAENAHKLRSALILVIILLVTSIGLNVFLLLK